MLKYQEVANSLEAHIREQQLAQGTKLPNVEQLLNEFHVSKSTITKALTLLEQNGVIYQVQGSGIFVRQPRRKGYINFHKPKGFTDDLEEFCVTSEVLSLEIQPVFAEIAKHLKIDVGSDIYYVKRLRFANGHVFCLEESYFPIKHVPFLNTEIATGSLFHYFAQALKLTTGFADNYLHVIQLDNDTAKLLNLNSGEPALTTEQIIHLSTGEPFDYSKVTYHYKNSQFFMSINK